MWQMKPLAIMIYRLQLILYTSKFNLNIHFLCIQRKYVQFYNIQFNMPKYHLLIGLETNFKTDRNLSISTFISHRKCTYGVTHSPLVYDLYTCENVDNYE